MANSFLISTVDVCRSKRFLLLICKTHIVCVNAFKFVCRKFNWTPNKVSVTVWFGAAQ